MKTVKFICIAFIFFVSALKANAQKDTLRVMAYNVLNYGQYPTCQGPNGIYHNYLDTIVKFTDPDVISLEKMASITPYGGQAPVGWGDSILKYALNTAFPARYAVCPYSNISAADNINMLFYNQNKLGYLAIVCSYANTTDFNTYKFYYKDPNISTTHDTTFIYFTINHDQSGTDPTLRNAQILGEMQQVQNRFHHLPNMLNMGDFNTRSSTEGCYQTLVNPADTNYRFYDPPFYPDNKIIYPANYDASPGSFTKFLTTSTRQYGDTPNTCGTSGGAKGWYDHIFVSPWVVNNANYVRYIPNSYRVIGNDGNRLGFSINTMYPVANTSAPATVLNALFQMSNKYPVMVDLEVTSNTTGTSLPDPEIPLGLNNSEILQDHVYIVNPVSSNLTMNFSSSIIGKTVFVECYDIYGRLLIGRKILIHNQITILPFEYKTGIYFIKLFEEGTILYNGKIVKE